MAAPIDTANPLAPVPGVGHVADDGSSPVRPGVLGIPPGLDGNPGDWAYEVGIGTGGPTQVGQPVAQRALDPTQVGRPVAQRPLGAPNGGTDYQPGVTTAGTRLRQYYTAATQKAGTDHFAWDDPTTLMLYQTIGGLSADQARWASQQAAAYYTRTGQRLGDYDLDQLLTSARTQAPATTDARPQLGAALRNAYADVQTKFGGSPPPNDPRVIQAFKDAAGRVGVTLTDAQAAQLGQQGQNYWQTTGEAIPDEAVDRYGGQVTGFSVPNPNQINPAIWDSLGPVGQGLAISAAQAKGWDAGEYQRQINATRPVGTAPRSGSIDYGSGLGTGIL